MNSHKWIRLWSFRLLFNSKFLKRNAHFLFVVLEFYETTQCVHVYKICNTELLMKEQWCLWLTGQINFLKFYRECVGKCLQIVCGMQLKHYFWGVYCSQLEPSCLILVRIAICELLTFRNFSCNFKVKLCHANRIVVPEAFPCPINKEFMSSYLILINFGLRSFSTFILLL